MPTFTQIEYALAVDKHRHFGRAAHDCHVSQPTLSQQLQKLEEEVGIMLFDRLQKPVLPTEEGRRFLEQARVVMREHQRLLYLTKQSRVGGLVGVFRLAIIPTIASHLVPLFVQDFSRAYPRVELSIEELKTDTILGELRNDRIDGAILATPVEGLNVNTRPLFYEPFQLYLSAGHALLKKKLLTREDLDAAQMWEIEDGNCFKNQVMNFCAFPRSHDSILENVRFLSGSLDTLKRMVQANNGYTMIPALMARSLPRAERVAHVRAFKAPVPTREVSLIHRRDHWKLDILAAIEKAVVASLPAGVSRRREERQLVLEVC